MINKEELNNKFCKLLKFFKRNNKTIKDFVISNNGEVLAYTEKEVHEDNVFSYKCYLNSIEIKGLKVALKEKIEGEYRITAFNKDYPLFRLDLIKIIGSENLYKGYGTTLIKYLEDLAKEHDCVNLQGNFIPLHGFNKEKTQEFYERNGYSIMSGNKNPVLIKDLNKTERLKKENINGLDFVNTNLTEVCEKEQELEK